MVQQVTSVTCHNAPPAGALSATIATSSKSVQCSETSIPAMRPRGKVDFSLLPAAALVRATRDEVFIRPAFREFATVEYQAILAPIRFPIPNVTAAAAPPASSIRRDPQPTWVSLGSGV